VGVVIPAYNEAEAIGGVIDGLLLLGYHVVVVNDGSRDRTADVALRRGVVVVSHPINRGAGAALQTGITVALALGADVIVTFDADGQHDPGNIAGLIAPILAGECDVTLGSRFLGTATNMPPVRRLVLLAGVAFTRLTARIAVTDTHNGLRAFSRAAAARLRITMDGMAHASEILEQVSEMGLRWREVPVTIRYTAYSLAKGQRSGNAIRIAAQVVLGMFSR
jgi:glycosyltransferase involved in cell wall biosynthesis